MRFAAKLQFAQQRLLLLPLVGLSVSIPVLFIILGLATQHAGILRYLLPALLPLCAVVIWFRSRSAYFGFVLAVWFFIPLLRRLVDYRVGPLDPNPMLLAPYLTTLSVPLFRIRSLLRAPVSIILPFVLCSAGILLGLVRGLLTYPVASVVHDCLNWITPVAFAAFITVEAPDGYAASFKKWFPLLVVGSAVYTILQFGFAFSWDMAWLVRLNLPSQGGTEPFALRAFGPLNSAGTAAFAFAAGSLFILNMRCWWRIPALAVTVPALLTTQVRAGWLVLACGILISLLKSPKSTAIALGSLVAVAICISGLGIAGEGHYISDRFASFEHPANDDSANGRSEGYYAAWNDLQSHPFGHGLGLPEDLFDIQGSFSLLDAAPVHILSTFGWLGGAAYCCGFLLLLIPVIRGVAVTKDKLLLLMAIPAISLTSVLFLGSVTVALSGFMIWSLLPSSLSLLGERVPEIGPAARGISTLGAVR